jgi:hypothetical protein
MAVMTVRWRIRRVVAMCRDGRHVFGKAPRKTQCRGQQQANCGEQGNDFPRRAEHDFGILQFASSFPVYPNSCS